MPDVVRADHEHDDLGLVAVQLAVVEAPQHVFGAVAAEAEVERVERRSGELLPPHRAALESVDDGVADEDDRAAALLDELLLFGEALLPPVVGPVALRNRRDGDDRCGKEHPREERRARGNAEPNLRKFHGTSTFPVLSLKDSYLMITEKPERVIVTTTSPFSHLVLVSAMGMPVPFALIERPAGTAPV